MQDIVTGTKSTNLSPAAAPSACPSPGTVEHWAQVKPDETAIIDGDRILTWREWNDSANRVAQALADQGISKGDVVGLRMAVRHEWAIVETALSKLGALLLGINPRLTPEELRHVMSDSYAKGMFCDDRDPALLEPALEGLAVTVRVGIEGSIGTFVSFSTLLETTPQERFTRAPAGLIIYTSGTTGKPKGVEVRPPDDADPAILGEYMASIRKHVVRSHDDIALCALPFSHGAGPALVRSAYSAGGICIFMRRFDPEQALALIARHRITFWSTVPTMLKRVAALPAEVLAGYDVSSITSISTGAAPVPPSLKQWVADYFGEVLSEGYGSTETGMIAYLSPEMQRERPLSSGRPLAHVSVRVRDEDGNLLPPGQIGELWVRTPVVRTSYLNAPPLGPDTVDADSHFKTGDVGYLDEDGFLYITDRVKDMIISGGVNVYPAEIEAALFQHSDVQDVAVIGVPDDDFGEVAKAFVELRPGSELTAELLLASVASTLAGYKRPKSIEFVSSLPRNAMGKVLKKDLREAYWQGRGRNV